MSEVTQKIVDALISEARARVPSGKAAELETDIKARAHNTLDTQASFLRRVIDAFDTVDVSKYAPATTATNGDGIRKPAATNPWSRAGWNVTAQARLVKSIGVEKAAAISAAAGCRIGDTRANPLWN